MSLDNFYGFNFDQVVEGGLNLLDDYYELIGFSCFGDMVISGGFFGDVWCEGLSYSLIIIVGVGGWDFGSGLYFGDYLQVVLGVLNISLNMVVVKFVSLGNVVDDILNFDVLWE